MRKSGKRQEKEEPWWKRRIERNIVRWRKDLARVEEVRSGKMELSRKERRRMDRAYGLPDEETMRVVKETLFGIVNRRIVEGIEQLGGNACGMSAKDAEIMRVKQHFAEMEDDEETKQVDIGFVGDVTHIDPEPIRRACDGETIPVITPIGLGEDGQSYNVNADTAAGEIARALQAEKLVFLTDVNGICQNPSDADTRISTLHVNDIDGLIDDGTIQGGMIPKVRAGERSVKGGVTKTHIIDGRIPHSQLLEMFTREGIGTQIMQ